ncbi:MAG: DUF3108 domain-containing protein [Candidatus Marinimicrobia bacterium]|nr:DUF3108 domain-containing protein [Candidatus Neomarinimicrobiota bacterium]
MILAFSKGQSEEEIVKGKNNSFQVGEKLTFSIGYEFIPAGKSILSVESIMEINGRSVYKITSRTSSYRFFDPFFKVRDEITTYLDTNTLQSIKFRKKLREGSYSYDYSIDFNPDSMSAVSQSPNGTRLVKIPEFTLDVLSAMYYMRTLDLKIGRTVTVTVLDNDKLYPLDIKTVRRERISTSAGTFDCLVIIPELKSGGLFKNEGRITAWVTDDHRKIPVLMKSKALIGDIIVELQKAEGLVE